MRVIFHSINKENDPYTWMKEQSEVLSLAYSINSPICNVVR